MTADKSSWKMAMIKSFRNIVCFFAMQTVVMKSKYITKIGFNLSIVKEIATKKYKRSLVVFTQCFRT